MNELRERCKEKSKDWAEQEAVNQKRDREWRERGEVSQMEKEREKNWPAAPEEGEIKMCGEVMAVMNSLWLISRSQVGV